MSNLFALVAFILVIFGYSFSSAKIISQSNEALVERLGKYKRTLKPGLNFVIPLLEKIVVEESSREKVLDIEPQNVITKDNVSLKVDAVVYWQIIELEKAFYGVEDIEESVQTLVLTTLRAEIGQLALDQTYSSRDAVNRALSRKLDDATEAWGVKVTRVEIKDLAPTKTILEALEQERAAQSRKKANILEAEGVATSLQKIAETLRAQPNGQQALEFLAAQLYIDANEKIGTSNNSKIL
ncbi:MAG: paraslipin, partial [Coleofasciculaceae cyanobacterium SM2_1_6]|nr:paraslipin [Coleofasciculaceae cyanobacterium SM2_1_6]